MGYPSWTSKTNTNSKRNYSIALLGKMSLVRQQLGKVTLAYGIPILEKYIQSLNLIKQNNKDKKINHPTGIIFAPTRELAHQVVDHLNKLAKYSPLSTREL